ncbi:MAG TPA: helix-turn-helix domain-containing protein, partial [Polyangiaceae bacterium LLY-WYZ-14_1]|nr:helix-turn-helix domain-containing protein [Polyangiaceae bacterium LLY-WYZ-14_1]
EAVRQTEGPPASGDEAPSEVGRPPDVETTRPAPGGGSASPPDSEAAFKARERARILEALERHGWNRARAARSLGMPRRTFYRRLSAYGIR